MTRARVVRVVALAAALAIMIALFARLGPTDIVEELDRVGVDTAWLLLVYAAGTIVGALPFYVLFPRDGGHRDRGLSLGAAIASRFAASGVNVVVPLFGMGGEPTRLLWLHPTRRAAGVAAIVVDRLTYAAASALFLAGGVIAAIGLTDLPLGYAFTALALALALLAIACATIGFVARHRIGGRLHRLTARVRRRTVPEPAAFGEDIDRRIEGIVRRRGSVAFAVLIGLCARFLLGAEVYIAFRILDIELSFAAAYTFAAVPVLLAFVGAVVPGQLGIQEGSQALVAGWLGIDPPTAVAAVLLTRIRQLVTAAIAWGLIALVKPPARAPAADPPPPSDP